MLKKNFLMLLLWCLLIVFLHERATADGQSYKGKVKANNSSSGNDRDFSNESLFTGDVAFSFPVTSIGGVPVNLSYSSNVHRLVWAENDVLQAGWVGLGWTLMLGSITADINNTRDVSDDRYFYINSDGSSELVLESGNNFRLKNYQYWKITRHLDGTGNLIGWTIVREEGMIYRYGNYDKNTGSFVFDIGQTNATRFSLGWGNLVTNPLRTLFPTGTKIAYQWDLSDIEDIFGNHTTINYQQETATLQAAGYTSSQYTRASYPLSIIDRTGRRVEFVLDNLIQNVEYTVPPNEIIQRYFQTKYLNEILLKDNAGVILQKYDLDYLTADVLSIGQTKRYLTKIKTLDGNGKLLPSTSFDYFGVGGNPVGDNRGALKKIIYPDGGEVQYAYSYQNLSNVILNYTKQYNSSSYPVMVTQDLWESGLSGSDFYALKVTDGVSNFLKVYRWGITGWYEDTNFPISGSISKFWVRNDYIVIKENASTMKVAKRKGDGWDLYNVNVTAGNSLSVAGAGNDFFVVKHNRTSSGIPTFILSEDASVVRWNNGNWVINYIGNYTLGFPGSEDDMVAACGSRFFALRSSYRKKLDVFVWNGTAWSSTFSQTFSYEISPSAGKDYFVTYNYTASPKSINVWHWDGANWGNGFSYYVDPNQGVTPGDNYFVFQGFDQAYIQTWTADPNAPWALTNIATLFGIPTSSFINGKVTVGRNYVAIGWLENNSNGKIGVTKYTNGNWGGGQILYTIASMGSGSYVTPVNNFNAFFTELWEPNGSSYHKIDAYIDDGTSDWNRIPDLVSRSYSGGLPSSLTQPGRDFVADVIGPFGDNGWSHALKQGFTQNLSIIFQGNPADYSVASKTILDGMGNSYTTNYLFENGVYDEDLNFAKYNKVTVTPPGNIGKTVTYFYNDLGSGVAEEFVSVPNYQELDGMSYKVKIFNSVNNLVQEVVNTWSVYVVDANQGIYHRRLSSTVTTLDGIQTSQSLTYNNTNGLVLESTETNTDNSVRVTRTIYAFERYSAISSKQMLSQVAQQAVYITSSTSASNARSSTVTTWKDWGSGKWAPVKTYNWLENDGPGVYSLPTFDFANWSDSGEPTVEPGLEWVRTSKIPSQGRDSYGNVLEIQDASGNSTTTKWGYNWAVPIATLSNATNATTFVDDFNDANLDDGIPVDWYTTGSYWTVTKEALHWTGNTSTAEGQCSIPNSISLTNFIAEFDVRVVDGYDPTDWGALHFRKNNSMDTPWTSGYLVLIRENGRVDLWNNIDGIIWGYQMTPSAQDWHHIRVAANGSSIKIYLDGALIIDVTNSRYNGSFAGFYAYRAETQFDNIRIYPGDALCSSQSYDPKMLLATRAIDQNGVSIFNDYDGFGRLLRARNEDRAALTATAYSDHAFSSSAPNFVESAAFPNGNYAPNWSFEAGLNGWEAFFNGQLSTVGNSVVQSRFGDYSLKVDDSSSDSNPDGAAFSFYNGEPNPWTAPNADEYHKLIGKPVIFSAWVRAASGTKNIRIGIEWNTSQVYSVTTTWQRISVSISSLTYAEPNPPETYAKRITCFIATDEPQTGAFYIDGVVLEIGSGSTPSEVQASTAFSDGLGRSIQTQTRNGSNDIIAKTTFNSIGKVDKQYKPQDLANANHKYYASLTGLYELFEYFDDPLARLKKQTHMGGASAINYRYASELFNGLTYRYAQVKDELSDSSRSYSDKFGNAVGGRGAIGTPKEIKWGNDYDILGNVTMIKPPNFWNPPSGTAPGHWDSQNAYNTFGQLTQSITPDDSTTKSVYDRNGNLRYNQNMAQVPTGDFTAYNYDKHNRVTLMGEEKNTDWTSSPPTIDSTTYGAQPNEWKVRYYYDVNYVTGVANYCQGKLTKTEVNDDSDGTAEHTTLYIYDKFGNLTEKRITIDGGSPVTEKIIRHSYDPLGRETQVTYPSNHVIARQYDQVGRLKKVYTIQ